MRLDSEDLRELQRHPKTVAALLAARRAFDDTRKRVGRLLAHLDSENGEPDERRVRHAG